jgi:hypothetical protein
MGYAPHWRATRFDELATASLTRMHLCTDNLTTRSCSAGWSWPARELELGAIGAT